MNSIIYIYRNNNEYISIIRNHIYIYTYVIIDICMYVTHPFKLLTYTYILILIYTILYSAIIYL
jgi:hypothetical protein